MLYRDNVNAEKVGYSTPGSSAQMFTVVIGYLRNC